MSSYDDIRAIMTEYGWSLVREKKHEIWHCPCGQHQITLAKTPSDYRSANNSLAFLRRTGCAHLPPEEADEDGGACGELENRPYNCHFCSVELKPADCGHTWVLHGDIAACLAHKGIPAWHGEERAKERAAAKAAKKAEAQQ